jgi:hypothetical protein
MSKSNIRLKTRVALLAFSALGAICSYAAQSDIESQIQHYIEIFKGDDYDPQHAAMGELKWSGISDERLFDIIANKVEKGIDPPPDEDDIKSQHLSHFAKALGRSGNQKYTPLLKKLLEVDNSTINRHAESALTLMEQYSKWNPVIARNIEQAPSGKLDEWRVNNMLESGIPELIRVGGKRIYYEHHDNPELTAKAVEVLLDGYKDPQTDIMADAMAWLCKGVAAGPNTEYVDTMKKVTQNTESYQVERYCEKSWVTFERMLESR